MKNGPERPPGDRLPDSAETSIDFTQLRAVLREKLWLIVLFALLGIFAGIAYIARSPRTFLATTVLEVNAQQMRLIAFDDVHPPSPAVADMADAVVAGFKSRPFLTHVVEDNKLTDNPKFLPEVPAGWQVAPDAAVNVLIGLQRVMVRRGTPFIDVSVLHTDPEMAQLLADALAKGYIKETMRRRKATSDIALAFLIDESRKWKGELEKSELVLQDYVEKSNSISLLEKEDIVVTRLKSISGQLIEAKATRMRLEADYDKVRTLAGQPKELMQIASVSEHPSVKAITEKISAMETAISTLALRYTDKHPKMIQVKHLLKETKDTLEETLAGIPALIDSNYEATKDTEAKFDAALKEQEKIALDLNKQAIPFKVLSREVDTNRALFESITKRLKEAEIAKGIELNNISIFEPAMLPGEPTQPKTSKVIAIALGAGLALGLALSLGLNALDSSLKTVEQTAHITGFNVLGAIPLLPGADAVKRALALHHDPSSPVAEAFRSVRASLHVAARGRGNQVVLITSAEPGEGKTFCAINYAVAAAQQGLRTLVIDADLRVSTVGRVLLPGRQEKGINDYLAGTILAADGIHATTVANLSVMPAGTPAPNPAELLAGLRFTELMGELRQSYDRIVIDTVPVLVVSDTMLIIEHADLVCLVVRAGKTSRKAVLRAAALLTDAGARPSGVLLNQMTLRSKSEYNRYIGKYGTAQPYGSAPLGVGDAAALQPTPTNTDT